MTAMTCSECGVECAVGIQNVAMIRGRWVMWRECCRCFLRKEREAAADRAQAKATLEAKLAKEKRVA